MVKSCGKVTCFCIFIGNAQVFHRKISQISRSGGDWKRLETPSGEPHGKGLQHVGQPRYAQIIGYTGSTIFVLPCLIEKMMITCGISGLGRVCQIIRHISTTMEKQPRTQIHSHQLCFQLRIIYEFKIECRIPWDAFHFSEFCFTPTSVVWLWPNDTSKIGSLAFYCALVDDIPMGWTIIDLVHQNQQTSPIYLGRFGGVQPR